MPLPVLGSKSYVSTKPPLPVFIRVIFFSSGALFPLQSVTRHPSATMSEYGLQHTLPCPGDSVRFMEFSPNGRFLIMAGWGQGRLHVLDRLAGFSSAVETSTISPSTSLTFESSSSFLVGLEDGRFVEYKIDLRSRHLVKGWTNDSLHGNLSVAAIALDATARILALAVGHDVFVFHRAARTGAYNFGVLWTEADSNLGQFEFTANLSNRFNFKREPGNATPPLPRSLCFTSNSQLLIAFCKQNLA